MSREFAHAELMKLRLTGAADERAPGAAITAELCGRWDHQGPCRWPHHTDVSRLGDVLSVRTEFDASPDEEPEVRRRIETAVARCRLRTPDGRVTSWELVPD